MDQTTVGGVHVPGDSHTYTSHQQNGFHMSTSNTGTAGEDNLPRAYNQKRLPDWFRQNVKQTALIYLICSRLQLDPGAAGRRRVSVLFQPRGEHFLPGGQLRPQPEPHVLRLHRDIEQHWSKARFTTPTPLLGSPNPSTAILSHFSTSCFLFSYKMWVP